MTSSDFTQARPAGTGSLVTLPYFVTRQNKLRVGAVGIFIYGVLYSASNRIHLFEPRLLPMTWIDLAVPFIPETFWIYSSEYLLYAVVFFSVGSLNNMSRFLYSMGALLGISVMIFWLWPTTFPRDQFPIPPDTGALTTLAFNFFRNYMDSPANCAPSLHVSTCYLASFLFLSEQRAKFPFFFLWATAVAVSTLTTKQHYIVDVGLGFGMAVAFHWIFSRWVSYRAPWGPNAAPENR